MITNTSLCGLFVLAGALALLDCDGAEGSAPAAKTEPEPEPEPADAPESVPLLRRKHIFEPES